MASRKGAASRQRVGSVSLYVHHGAWWIYYRDGGQPVRRKIGDSLSEASQVAAQVNAQLASGEPTLFASTPISVADLREQLLDYHEHVLHCSVGTLARYRGATQHLLDFVGQQSASLQAHQISSSSAAWSRPMSCALPSFA